MSAVGSTHGGSAVSRSRYLLPAATWLVATSVSEDDAGVRRLSINELNVSQSVSLAAVPVLKSFGSAGKIEEEEGNKGKCWFLPAICIRESGTLFPDVAVMEGVGFSQTRCSKGSRG